MRGDWRRRWRQLGALLVRIAGSGNFSDGGGAGWDDDDDNSRSEPWACRSPCRPWRSFTATTASSPMPRNKWARQVPERPAGPGGLWEAPRAGRGPLFALPRAPSPSGACVRAGPALGVSSPVSLGRARALGPRGSSASLGSLFPPGAFPLSLRLVLFSGLAISVIFLLFGCGGSSAPRRKECLREVFEKAEEGAFRPDLNGARDFFYSGRALSACHAPGAVRGAGGTSWRETRALQESVS